MQLLLSTQNLHADRIGHDILLKRGSSNYFQRAEALSESMLQDYLALLLPALDINLVLDVGANRGQYATLIRGCGYQGRLVSFEPIPELFEALRQRAQHDPAWTVLPYACGSTDAEVDLNITATPEYSSILTPNAYAIDRDPHAAVVRTQSISVRRLDALLPQILQGLDSPRVYLKMDTQGYDLEVFAGLGHLAQTAIVALQSELPAKKLYDQMPGMTAVLAHYEQQGFTLNNMFPVSHDHRNPQVIEYDCIMTRQG